VLPLAPRNLAVTNIQSTSVMLQFKPGFDGFTSITTWILESQMDRIESEWSERTKISNPDASAIEVLGLRPYTAYRLRIIAVNVAGRSQPSVPTMWFDTLKTVPSVWPSEISVKAWNETALLVQWMVSFIEKNLLSRSMCIK
jgi:protein sidekick